MQNYYVPRIYLSDFILDFDQMAERYALTRRVYPRGETLTEHGVINNTAHYIRSGLTHLSITHSTGNQKSLMFFGPRTVFPLGVVPHENVIDYEMVIRALTDVETYSFPYPVLRKMCVENGEFAAQVLEENCEMVGYLFYAEMNQSFAPTEIRVCDVLLILLFNLRPAGDALAIRQEELASLAGASSAQLERVLKDLRARGIVETSRGKIRILDIEGLRGMCSTDLRR